MFGIYTFSAENVPALLRKTFKHALYVVDQSDELGSIGWLPGEPSLTITQSLRGQIIESTRNEVKHAKADI